MSNPLVSVIVTVQNGERYLTEALQSIIAQTYSNYEIILVNGDSHDKTEAIARSYPLRYYQQSKPGLAHGRNTGILAAKGELIAFLDHDDIWMPHKLQRQVEHLYKEPESQGAIAHLKFFLEPNCSLRPGFKPESLYQPQIGYTPGTLLVRNKLFEQIGLFDPQYNIGCDADWFAKLKDRRILITILDEILLHKRLHDTNLSNNVSTSKRELFQVVQSSIQRQRNISQD